MTGKRLIAIVDDDQSSREGTRDLLDAMGFNALSFDCADEFLGAGYARRTACLITDMRMPKMTGFELRARLMASGYDIPTILITAFPNRADRNRALAAGIHCYLSKPLDEEKFLQCLRSALRVRKATP
jgi:FixJ family two-component response regulator